MKPIEIPIQNRGNIDDNNRAYDIDDNNRAYDTRRDTDNFITPSITLYDIDYAILYHLNDNLNLSVMENGNSIKVPVMIANGEKWAQIQRYGFLRERHQKLMSPLIVIKRTTLSQDQMVEDLNVRTSNIGNQIYLLPHQQNNNQNDFLNKTQNTKKSFEYYICPLPERVIVNYDIYIWTTNIDQMNYIVENLIQQHKLLWGDVMSFVTTIGDYSFDYTNDVGEDRFIKCSVPLTVNGLLLNEFDLKQSTLTKAFTTKRLVMINESEQDDIYPDQFPSSLNENKSRLPPKQLPRFW